MSADKPSKKTIGFLGPAGSFTEIALDQYLNKVGSKDSDTEPSKVPFQSIEEVFNALRESRVDSALLPIENLLQGPVTETLDLLYQNKNKVHIADSVTINIALCLGCLKKKDLKTFEQVHSKDIALRQCSNFINKHLPHAKLVSEASTTSAAERVKRENLHDSLVIAAESTLINLGFTVLHREIADRSRNQTRFILLKAGSFSSEDSDTSDNTVTSIVVDPRRDRQGLLFEILEVISVKHRYNLKSIHSRPDGNGGFVFHLDLEGGAGSEALEKCLDDLRTYCAIYTGETAEVSVFGRFQQKHFSDMRFNTVGIVGGEGMMGRWFQNFFRSVGLQVLIHDPISKDSLSLKDLCHRSEVIVLSIPMSAIKKTTDSISSFLTKKHLVVENCSIKAAALPYISANVPDEVEVLGVHTMFGGSAKDLRGQNVLITPTNQSREKAQSFEDLLYKHGAICNKVEMEAHDRASAIMQASIQCALVSLADIISETCDSPEQLDIFSTPNSREVVSVIQRILTQSDELLCQLQVLNPQANDVRLKLLESLTSIVSALEKGDSSRFIKALKRSRSFFDKL